MRKRKALASRGKGSSRRSTAAEAPKRVKRSFPAGDLSRHLERIPRFPLQQLFAPPPASRFQRKLLEASDGFDARLLLDEGGEDVSADKDCILSQDFFCTPDYITPEIPNNLNLNKENIDCPKSPEKSIRNKKCRQENENHLLDLQIINQDNFSKIRLSSEKRRCEIGRTRGNNGTH